jgi:hypothetical protein
MYFTLRDRQFVNILNFKMHAFICTKKFDESDELRALRNESYGTSEKGPLIENV